MDWMSLKWPFYNSTLFYISLFILFLGKPTTSVSVIWDMYTSILLFFYILKLNESTFLFSFLLFNWDYWLATLFVKVIYLYLFILILWGEYFTEYLSIVVFSYFSIPKNKPSFVFIYFFIYLFIYLFIY